MPIWQCLWQQMSNFTAEDPPPRWLMTHGHASEAERVVTGIESRVMGAGHVLSTASLPRGRLRARSHTPLSEVAHTLFHLHRRRTLVGLSLMGGQAFF